jgi:hypothetical protein
MTFSRRNARARWLIVAFVSLLGCSSPISSTGTGGQAGTSALAGAAGGSDGGTGGDNADAGADGSGGTGGIGGGGAGGAGGVAGAGGQPPMTCLSCFCAEVVIHFDGAIAAGTRYTISFDDNTSEHLGGVVTCTLSSSADGKEDLVCNGGYLHRNSGARELTIANRIGNLGVHVTGPTTPAAGQTFSFGPTFSSCASYPSATIHLALP